MRLLDLFCGAGMAADGYAQAGFDVEGFDARPQPNYPYRFTQGDALEVLKNKCFLRQFDLIHASPPCQAHTRAKHLRDAQGGKSKYCDLLTPTLELLREADVPWVVENVPGSPGMDGAAVECGSAYGLKVRRHRLFLASFPLAPSGCKHKEQGNPSACTTSWVIHAKACARRRARPSSAAALHAQLKRAGSLWVWTGRSVGTS